MRPTLFEIPLPGGLAPLLSGLAALLTLLRAKKVTDTFSHSIR